MRFHAAPVLRTLALLSLSPVISAGPTPPLERRATTPANDPFYNPPAGFASKAPGTILNSRPIAASFLGLLPDPVQAYQLLYRTTSVNGSAIAEVTTVFKPLNAATDKFVSFQTAYDSSNTKCNPSYTYQLLAPQTDLITSAEMLIIQGYLASGYIVSSPDYEGPDAAFSAGRLAGMGVLDSMRAVSQYSNLSFSQTPNIVGVGYSGGAIATGWAASLHRNYASELPVKGWVQGGTPANLTGTLLYLDNSLFSGFLPAAVVGLNSPSTYGAQLSPVIDAILTPKGRSIVNYAATHCATNDLGNFAFQSLLSPDVQTLGSGLLYQPTIASVLKQNTMGTYADETPIAPVYIYHATQDEVIPYANASTLANTWCQNGASVSFTTLAAGGHISSEIIGFPAAITFAQSAFAGTVPSGCSRTTTYNNTLNPVVLTANLEPILINLIQGLVHTGQGDQNIKSNLTTLNNTIS